MVIELFSYTFSEYLRFYMILVGHKAHTTLKSILFKKYFRISNASNKDYSSGEIINLTDRDANRVWSFVWELSTLLSSPFQMTVAGYFLWTNLGPSCLTGFFLYLMLYAINKYKSKLHRRTWKVIDRKRDKRMQQTQEAFTNAKMLKLQGWEQKFQSSVTSLYSEEIDLARRQENFNRIVDFIPNFLEKILPVIMFCTYVYFGNQITMAKIVLCEVMIRRFNGNIGHLIRIYMQWDELTESLQKVHKFYASNEIQKGIIKKSKDVDNEVALKVKGNFSWGFQKKDDSEKDKDKKGPSCFKRCGQKCQKKVDEKEADDKASEKKKEDEKKPTFDSILDLKDIDISVKKGEFVCIIGEVGAGKTSLLNSVIGEMLYVP